MTSSTSDPIDNISVCIETPLAFDASLSNQSNVVIDGVYEHEESNYCFMKFNILFMVVAILFCGISGCNSEPVPVPVVVAKATRLDWDAALKASNVMAELKDDGNGITEYRSVFSTSGDKPMDVLSLKMPSVNFVTGRPVDKTV